MSEKKCAHPGCTSTIIFSRNFCNAHYLAFVRGCKQNGSWRPYDQTLHDQTVQSRTHWTYVGDEDALVRMVEQEENKNEK